MRNSLRQRISTVYLISPACLLLIVLASPEKADAGVETVANGLVNTVDSFEPNAIFVANGPGDTSTTINLVDPNGFVSADLAEEYSLLLTQDSILNMTGGETEGDIILTGRSIANVSGGIAGDNLTASGNAQIIINDVEEVSDDIEALDGSFMEVFNGTFIEDAQAEGNALVVIHGGQFMAGDGGGFIEPAENGRILIRGGEFGVGASTNSDAAGSIITVDDSSVLIFGGTHHGGGADFIDDEDWPFGVADLAIFDSSQIVIFGSAFVVNGFGVGPGSVLDIGGDVSGILSDGTPFALTFTRDFQDGAQLILVPEPASAALLLLSAAGMIRRRRVA